jgi:hypothetical protein
MGFPTDQPRFVLAVGDATDQIAEDPATTVLERLDRVVLVAASRSRALDIRQTAGPVVHIYKRESDARRAFRLFEH